MVARSLWLSAGVHPPSACGQYRRSSVHGFL